LTSTSFLPAPAFDQHQLFTSTSFLPAPAFYQPAPAFYQHQLFTNQHQLFYQHQPPPVGLIIIQQYSQWV